MCSFLFLFFFFNDTATTEIYTYRHTLSLHDSLPISASRVMAPYAEDEGLEVIRLDGLQRANAGASAGDRSEEHTSELQSLMRISYAVFCLKKKNKSTKGLTS